ncbi:hypothetical protein [Stenotrophomonas sp. CFBP8980]|uniref:hypothetical protein n=1 Tax=Stenotrophomonas sp. CFBP8980 TaxID=3096523 RepID=UPI002A6B2DC5|nr:hypothetical protein [Stenotrophomonas sp. CFBP8980]
MPAVAWFAAAGARRRCRRGSPADRFTAIRQAVAVPSGRNARAIATLHAGVEKLKAGNELAEAFARSGHFDVSLVGGA